MSWLPCPDRVPGDARAADVTWTVIIPRARDLGGFAARRALPSRSGGWSEVIPPPESPKKDEGKTVRCP